MKALDRLGAAACAAFVALAVTACGGGGGSDASSLPASYWRMDTHTYANGGTSATSSAAVSGNKTLTTTVVSTATLSGGDQSNGAYSGSSMNFIFFASGAGTYNIVADRATLLAQTATSKAMMVECIVGSAVTTGATQYAATAGTVTVTVDGAGKYHFATDAAVPMGKQLDVLGGVAGAPATMQLTVVDAY